MGRHSNRRGFSLMAVGVSSAAIVGMLGVAVDLGRVYIARNETQAYVDSAAIAGALELDGSLAGVSRAQSAVAANINKWNFGTTSFSNPAVSFSSTSDGSYVASPASGSGLLFVKVEATVQQTNYFVPAIGNMMQSNVKSIAIAGQVPRTTWREGTFPFSPLAHNNSPPDFGLSRGQQYTFRWPANPRVNHNVCAGDNNASWINQAEAGGGSERGYIEETSASTIRESIIGNYQTTPLSIGDVVHMTGGAKQTELNALGERVGQDTDQISASYETYHGNGRRLIVMPINTYNPDYQIVGFGAFFLLRMNEYNSGGNTEWCAQYVGPYVQGAKHTGAGTGGAFVVRLVQ